ncbi:MAG: prephenate dehydrogenase [Halobacteriovoraceae bacterium]|nr:prephenate dehydrogenase [Halobacteriovoraceae bacterium]
MKLALIGFGRFGQLIAKTLVKDFELIILDSNDNLREKAKKLGALWGKIEDLEGCRTVVLATPISTLPKIIDWIKPHLNQEALVIDVCSVKEWPLTLMKEGLPNSVNILGTHPMFGPDSVKEDFKNHKIVLCPESISEERLKKVTHYLQGLGLTLLTKTAKDHDEEISRSLILTHFIGRTLIHFGAEKLDIETKGYQSLLTILKHVGNDSPQLFQDMNRYNPYAKKMRRDFTEALQQTVESIS